MPHHIPRGPGAGSIRTWAVVIGLSALVVATAWLLRFVAWNTFQSPVDRALRSLVVATGEDRFTEARLTEPFRFGRLPEPARGAADASIRPEIERAALQLHLLAASERTAATLRGAGIAFLAQREIDRAIVSLDASVRLAPTIAAARADLSAALLERWRRDRATADAARALDEAERAYQIDPGLTAAAFNRALALQAMSLAHEAARAWERYLHDDAASPWSNEVRDRMRQLTATVAPEPAVILDLADAALETLARNEPLAIYRALERHALPQWATAVLAGTTPKLTDAARLANALERANRDRSVVGMVRFASSLSSQDADRRAALARAIVLLDRWWAPYDDSSYDDAYRIAVEARGNLLRAGAPTVEADIRASIVDVARGRTADGIARLGAIEATAQAGKFGRILAMCGQLRGLAAMQRTMVDEAIEAYLAALRAAQDAGDTELEALTRAYLGTAHWTQGNRAAAWSDFSESAQKMSTVISVRRGFQLFSRATELAQQTGLAGAALAVSEALLHDPVQSKSTWTQCAGRMFLARAQFTMGRPDRAAAELDAARRAADDIADARFRGEVLAEVAITTGQILATADPRRAIAALSEALTFQTLRANQFRTASLLLTRGRAYQHAGDATQAEADWTEGATLLEDARASIRDAQLRIARTADTWQLFEELVQIQRDRPRVALQTVERAHARELMDSIAPTTDLTPYLGRDDYSWLPARSMALVYAVTPERLLIWTVTARGVTLHQRALTASDLGDLVEASVTAIRRDHGPDGRLAEVLLPDDVSFESIDTLIVVPDGSLYQVPFGWLREARTRTRLLDSTVVTVAPSLAVLKALLERPRRPAPATPLLVGVGLANSQERVAALPAVATELAGLRAIYPSARVLSGLEARPEVVLEQLKTADLLHFAGHAVSDDARPARSRLLLAPGRSAAVLGPADIASTPMRPGGIVVLGACDTAAGVTFKGEGPLNLARPFLIAGAASVIATLWPVADSDASRLLLDLHRLIASGMQPGRALATVQRNTDDVALSTRVAFVLIGRT